MVYTFIAFLIAILANGGGRQAVIACIARQQQTETQPPPPAPPRDGEIADEAKEVDEALDLPVDPPDNSGGSGLSAPCPCCIPARVRQQRNGRGVAASILWQCQTMAIQFVLLKPLLAATPFIIKMCGVDYDNHPPIVHGNIDWTSPRLYVLFVANVSVSLAFYGLLSFYHVVAKELAWCDPWPKFLCIKGIVFFSFWQDITLQIMSGWGLVDSTGASQIQNLLICIEMFMASIAHVYVFPHHEWKKGYQREEGVSLFRDTLALPDFVTDVRQIASRDGWAVEEDSPSLNGREGRRREGSVGSYGSTAQSARMFDAEGKGNGKVTAESSNMGGGLEKTMEPCVEVHHPRETSSISSLEVSESTLFRSAQVASPTRPHGVEHCTAEVRGVSSSSISDRAISEIGARVFDSAAAVHWSPSPNWRDMSSRSDEVVHSSADNDISLDDDKASSEGSPSWAAGASHGMSYPFQSDLSHIGNSSHLVQQDESADRVIGERKTVPRPSVILHESDEELSADEVSSVVSV